MALRGKTPAKTEKRLKGLFFGEPGAGKTTAAIQFPRPYLIDTERGAENDEYVEIIKGTGGQVYPCNDWHEIVQEVRSLISTKHEFRTLIIDPITTIYDDAVDQAEARVGNEWGRHYGAAKKDWKRLGRLLGRLDMNVIITAHSKKEYDSKSGKVIGETYDGPKGLDYLFDLVFQVQKRSARERVGVVRKTRLSAFPEADVFPFSYDEIASRYGRRILEREAISVILADDAQVEELNRMLEPRRDGDDLLAKWLKKAGAEAIEEMPADAVQKCIDWLKNSTHTLPD